MKTSRYAFFATAVLAGCASTTTKGPPEASIPFINMNQSIHEWQADGTTGVWIQDARKNWYYARLQTICIGLDFAMSLGFKTATSSTLDRFGSVLVPREGACPIASLTKSDGPPDDKNRHKTAE